MRAPSTIIHQTSPNGMNQQFMSPQMPMNFNLPMSIPMPNFGHDFSVMEYQKYIFMIMNYYENHMNNMKTIIVQQNDAINQEKRRNQVQNASNSLINL